MREIKFRAWFKLLKRMYVVRELRFNRNKSIVIITNHTGGTAPNSYELMQFTGLKDKNGKEIFEGDIVKMKSYYLRDDIELGGTYVVEWEDVIDGTLDCDVKNQLENNIEVIGNIYENPELLK